MSWLLIGSLFGAAVVTIVIAVVVVVHVLLIPLGYVMRRRLIAREQEQT